jgi:hypothetical protein
VLLADVVTYADGAHTVKCAIRDLSEDGARISISSNIHLPLRFYLINVRDRLAYEAQSIWRSQSEAGVKFSDIVQLASPSRPQLQYLDHIWQGHAQR